MGYRNYLGSIPKYEKSIYTKFTSEEEITCSITLLHPNDDYTPYQPPQFERIFEIVIDGAIQEKVINKLENFYPVNIDEHEFKIFTKEQFSKLIHEEIWQQQAYITKISKDLERCIEQIVNYDKYTTELNKAALVTARNYLKRKTSEWENGVYLKETSEYEITGAWTKEVGLMNYMYLYKIFDWDKNYLVLTGW